MDGEGLVEDFRAVFFLENFQGAENGLCSPTTPALQQLPWACSPWLALLSHLFVEILSPTLGYELIPPVWQGCPTSSCSYFLIP